MDLDQSVECSACGYDLTGVGWEGRCPECGGYYDKSSARGIRRVDGELSALERGDRLVTRLKVAALVVLGVLCLGCGGLMSVSSPMPARPLLMGLLFAGAFGFAAYATHFAEKRGRDE